MTSRRLALLLAAILLLTGCASTCVADTQTPASIAAINTKDMDFTFSDRELAGTYEARKAVTITGSGSTAAIEGSGAALSGGAVRITQEGVYLLSGEFSGLPVHVVAGDNDKVQLVLDNASITCPDGPALLIESADKVFITLPEGTQNTLSDGAHELSADAEASQPDAALFSRADLCINGSGALGVSGLTKHGIVSKDDLVLVDCTLTVSAVSTALDGKDCVKVIGAAITVEAGSNGLRSDNAEDGNRGFIYLKDCTLDVMAGSDGIQAQTVLMAENAVVSIVAGGGASQRIRYADGSWKGLKSGGDMLLSGGSYTISSRDDCIHSNSSIVITDGVFSLSSGDDGVHADTDLTITGGDLVVHQSYEGLEASKLTIAGGHIDVTASDDGLNAAGGADGSAMGNRFGRGMFSNGVGEIIISGGYTVVNASGDGIDSNGSISVSGGVTLVSGPVSGGNASFDYDGSATVTGGVLIATGPSGMAQNFSSAEDQGAMLVSFGSRAGRESIALTDADGVVLAAFTPVNAYQCAVITAPGIQQGQTYTLLAGCEVAGADDNGFAQGTAASGGTLIDQITMTELLYGGNGGFGMWQQPGQRQNPNQHQNQWQNRPGGGNRHGW